MPKYRNSGVTLIKEKLYISKLKSEFGDRDTFSRSDLIGFYTDLEPDISQSVLNWRILSLTKKGILERVGHGMYQFGEENTFEPYLNDVHKTLYKELDKKFPYADKCIWSTSILNEFMVHQPAHFMTVIEIDREARQNAFYFLKDRGSEVFLEMDADLIGRYSTPDKETVLVKALVTEAPTQTVHEVHTVTLEKVLVDVFCDRNLFSAFQGAERSTIFEEAFAKYTLNQNKLLRYAGRRGKRKEVSDYLKKLDLIVFQNL